MFSSFEWGVAFRYLKARRGDKFISVIAGFSLGGICLGVMVLIVVMAVMNGFRNELLDRVLGVNGHAMVVGYSGGLDDYDRLTEEIRAYDTVTRANPIIQASVATAKDGRLQVSILNGVTPENIRGNDLIAANILEGSLDFFGEPATIAIGYQLARSMNARVGDQLTVLSPNMNATPFGAAPRMQAFEIVALFEVGVYDYDNAFIFMPLDQAQIFFKTYNTVTAIEIFVEDPDDIDGVTATLAAMVEGRGYVNDWRQLNQSLFTALVVERNVMFLILTLIILVAVFNIISSMIILVKDKSRDIAILMTMGASRRSLMKIFMVAGASIGFAGTLLGLVLGVLVAGFIQPIQSFIEGVFQVELWSPEIRFLTEMPAEIKISEVALVVVIAFLLSFLATLPPARRAANLDPVEVLRNEA